MPPDQTTLQQACTVTVHSSLNRLRTGERVRGIYAIQRMRLRRRSDAPHFWEIVLADASGAITTYAWSRSLRLDTLLPAGTWVQVEFRTRKFGNQLVGDLAELDILPLVLQTEDATESEDAADQGIPLSSANRSRSRAGHGKVGHLTPTAMKRNRKGLQ
jgi:hypothetical protein